MTYNFDQFASDLARLNGLMLAAAGEGESIDITVLANGDPDYSAGSIALRVGGESTRIRIRPSIGSFDDPRESVIGSRMDSAGAGALMNAAFAWLRGLPTPRQRKLSELIRALEKARELTTAAGLEDDAIGDLLRAAMKMSGNLLPSK
jgi:hypothetical protein